MNGRVVLNGIFWVILLGDMIRGGVDKRVMWGNDERERFGTPVVRIAGMLTIVWGLVALPNLPIAINGMPAAAAALLVFRFLIVLGAGLILFWSADIIVHRVVARQLPSSEPKADLRAVEEIALAILGFYLLAIGVPGLLFGLATQGPIIFKLIVNRRAFGDVYLFANFIAPTTQIIIGVLFAFRSGWVVAVRRAIIGLRPMARDR